MKNDNLTQNDGGRNLSIDFLRLLCMFGIVWLHAGTFGYYAEDGIQPNVWVIHFKYMLAVCVDIFAFISGWYGVKFRLKKFIRIIILSFFCGVVAFFISHYFFNCAPMDWRIIVHYCVSNWYFIGYLVLMLISPLINAGLERIESENFKSFLLPFILLCLWQFASSIVPSTHPSGVGRDFFSRYSFVTIINIYIIGRIIRKLNFLERFKAWHLLLVAFFLSLFTAFSPLHYYTSPFVIVEAICIFEIFRRIKIPVCLGKISRFLAPSMFSILLLHRENDFCKAIFIPFENTLSVTLFPFISVFVAAFIVFNVCLIIDLLRRLILLIAHRSYKKIKERDEKKDG